MKELIDVKINLLALLLLKEVNKEPLNNIEKGLFELLKKEYLILSNKTPQVPPEVYLVIDKTRPHDVWGIFSNKETAERHIKNASNDNYVIRKYAVYSE